MWKDFPASISKLGRLEEAEEQNHEQAELCLKIKRKSKSQGKNLWLQWKKMEEPKPKYAT